MITEGLVALIWAAVSAYFFFDGGAAEAGSSISAQAPEVVTKVSKGWLGIFGGILAMLGVVAAPITSGDTALRSARIITADFLKIDQKRVRNRLFTCIPIFIIVALLLWFNMSDAQGFNKIWGWFGWANQTLSVFMLWTATIYLSKRKKGKYYFITLIPSSFMTSVVTTYFIIPKTHLLPSSWTFPLGVAVFIVSLVLFDLWRIRRTRKLKMKSTK